MDTAFAIILLIWSIKTTGPKKIWRKHFYCSRDCWRKGWDFEGWLIFQVMVMLASGVYLCWKMHPGVIDEMLTATQPSLGVTIFILLLVIFGFVWARRRALYYSHRRKEAYEALRFKQRRVEERIEGGEG